VESHDKLKGQLPSGKDLFTARNESQVYYCRSLAIAYIEGYALHRFAEDKVFASTCSRELQDSLRNLYMLYGLWTMEKYLQTFIQGRFLRSGKQVELIRKGVLCYCSLLKNDSVVLVDAIAPPDWVLNSAIGHSNGQPLKNLYENMVMPESQERPSWWREMNTDVNPGSKSHLISKL